MNLRFCRPSSILQLFQQFASSRFHSRGACSQALLKNPLRRSSQTRILPGEAGQTLQRKGFHDGTAIFQVALQGRGGARPLWPPQVEPRNDECQVPPQLDLLCFVQQTQQFLFVGFQQLRPRDGDFFRRIRRLSAKLKLFE